MTRTLRALFGVSATLAVAASVYSAVTGEWLTACWAFTAAVALTAHALRPDLAPPPEPAQRGQVAITFVGGPLDGADIPLPPVEVPELLDQDVVIEDTQYRITSVTHTHYNAEVQT